MINNQQRKTNSSFPSLSLSFFWESSNSTEHDLPQARQGILPEVAFVPTLRSQGNATNSMMLATMTPMTSVIRRRPSVRIPGIHSTVNGTLLQLECTMHNTQCVHCTVYVCTMFTAWCMMHTIGCTKHCAYYISTPAVQSTRQQWILQNTLHWYSSWRWHRNAWIVLYAQGRVRVTNMVMDWSWFLIPPQYICKIAQIHFTERHCERCHQGQALLNWFWFYARAQIWVSFHRTGIWPKLPQVENITLHKSQLRTS